jgi:hypothetical protein
VALVDYLAVAEVVAGMETPLIYQPLAGLARLAV